jgi:transcriptional regulator with XRE-family HTH domain
VTTMRDLVSEALRRKPKAELARALEVAPAMVTRWLNGTSEPDEREAETLRKIAAQPPADDKVEATPQAAPGLEAGGPTVAVESTGTANAGPSEIVRSSSALSEDRKRHEQDVADIAALVASPGWQRIVLPQVLAKRETHRNALLDAKGRDVPLNQGAYAALAWLCELVKKPADELAAARAEMPLFDDSGVPAGAKGGDGA